jgi:hypothetical protein
MAAKNHYRDNLKERGHPEHPQYWIMENSTNTDDYFNSGVMKYFYENWKSQDFTKNFFNFWTELRVEN